MLGKLRKAKRNLNKAKGLKDKFDGANLDEAKGKAGEAFNNLDDDAKEKVKDAAGQFDKEEGLNKLKELGKNRQED